MNKTKLSFGLLMLLALPPAFLELLNNVYNIYVPIFLQAGGPSFTSKGTTLTLGFGLGALLVGFWMVADNIFGFIAQPFVGAWSDRTHTRRGRRIPYILYTLPFIVAGYALIPVAPTLIPQAFNGQQGKVMGLFIFFTLACVVYYLGWSSVRIIFMALRQEAVETKDRIKVESWYNFLLNILTIIAFTAGAALYRVYGPLLFWVILALYVAGALWLSFKYKEPLALVESAQKQEGNNFKQLWSVFRDSTPAVRRNLVWFLLSVAFFTLAASAYTNFSSSWAVAVLGVNEASASNILAIITLASTLVVLPAGYIASGRFGRRKMYLVGLSVMFVSGLMLTFIPGAYMLGFILLGAGAGIGFPAQLPLASELADKPERMGSVIGVYNFAYLFGFILGSFIVGALIQNLSYLALFPAICVFMALSTVCFLFVKAPSARPALQPQPAPGQGD